MDPGSGSSEWIRIRRGLFLTLKTGPKNLIYYYPGWEVHCLLKTGYSIIVAEVPLPV